MYYSKDMEALATGFKRIDDECSKAGVRYEFFRDTYGFTVRFYRHCGEGWSENQSSHRLSEKGDKKVDKKAMKKGDEIATRVEKVYEVIFANPEISVTSLALEINATKKQTEKALGILKQTVRIHREGPANGGKWVVN